MKVSIFHSSSPIMLRKMYAVIIVFIMTAYTAYGLDKPLHVQNTLSLQDEDVIIFNNENKNLLINDQITKDSYLTTKEHRKYCDFLKFNFYERIILNFNVSNI